MGIGCKPIGKFESIMRKMSNEKQKELLVMKTKEKKPTRRANGKQNLDSK